ncbi:MULTISPECIES: glutamate ABC transporter substrate-binding protein [Streptomyces]|uniref:Sugar-binding protein n=1 Tax=Streptomyces tsukubensis (strain DSM 42081 / NBRC 108919 / NRRL 18488 / 9993) TaxID=1114943 RepID=I2MYC2_STRT9|nr:MULTISPECIES: glutamate ABC transporter substrate-binding protein [Streptomyces]AZK94105.1 sugar-binding protein [Streptomyces tsukubensis]EIF89769.1 family 3 extracellular solute-binding protein [Streptomyces tsukubensis NRRL18488]MYS63513.1 transporter substrate-binding domain-containing protein [Streptomyces sp. SID5473]QKM69785.1 sugar-binding protein [Streptomyces tsukubensis NRRL18488]TAI46245.1 glutamate ABC transporter substrate-binding protein [Streptomyces tsukubensis]
MNDSGGDGTAAATRRPTPRGWGGVAAMAAVCALAAGTLIPLSRDAGSAIAAPDAPDPAGGVTRVAPATTEPCESPEASLPPSADDGPTIDAIKKRGHLIVGVDQNSYRWGYRDPATGAIAGFDIDLARAIAVNIFGSKKNAVVFRAIPTNQRIPALNNGTVDIVVRTMTINCARIRQVAFSTAYFQAGQQILASKSSPISGYNATLKGKRVCSAEGSTAYEALEKNAFGSVFKDAGDGRPDDEDILTVPNQLDCLVRLQQGLVDAVLTDNALAAGQAAQDPAVELKGDKPFTTEYYGVATKLGKDDLVRRINHVLEEYRKGEWTLAYQKWLKADLPEISGPPAPKYRTG